MAIRSTSYVRQLKNAILWIRTAFLNIVGLHELFQCFIGLGTYYSLLLKHKGRNRRHTQFAGTRPVFIDIRFKRPRFKDCFGVFSDDQFLMMITLTVFDRLEIGETS